MYDSPRDIPLPARSTETAAYWDAAAQGQLLVKRCRDCGQAHHYPRSLCPFCFSSRTEWETASGLGTVYSYSVMRRAKQPYVIAWVTLAEGPTLMTNLIGCSVDSLAIGQAVRLAPGPAEGGPPIPMFVPAWDKP
jgi:uncharacterized OB-fold protein